VFNGERYIAALESVSAQTRPVEEVIVIDDGSTDATVAIVESFPDVTLLRQANRGPSAARNLGITQAGGDYLAMLDADDLWPANRQEIMAGMLDDDPSLGGAGQAELFAEPGSAIYREVEGTPRGSSWPADRRSTRSGCTTRR
jgi:glycosyltransferase involved in cell wall biosynthesis